MITIVLEDESAARYGIGKRVVSGAVIGYVLAEVPAVSRVDV